MERRGLSAYIAELVGTFLLVLFIALVVSVYARKGIATPEFVVIGLLHAFVLGMLIQTLGGVSGAHFNPAVTVGLASVRKISMRDAGGYIVVQIIGAIAGAALAKLILDELPGGPNLGNVSICPALGGKAILGALGEGVGAFALVWAVMGVAVNPRADADWAGFVIGTTLGFAVFVLAPLTGAGDQPGPRARPRDRGGRIRRRLRQVRGRVPGRADRRRAARGGGLQTARAGSCRPPGRPPGRRAALGRPEHAGGRPQSASADQARRGGRSGSRALRPSAS